MSYPDPIIRNPPRQKTELTGGPFQSMTEARSYPAPFHLQEWIGRHEKELRPPIGNKLLFGPDTELQVMVVGGPNRRTDYHVEAGEEWFYQLKGEMALRLVYNDEFQSVAIRQGQTFLLPAQIPHSPRRPPESLGIVVERRRSADELDQMQWYCDRCSRLVHKEQFHCQELDSQLASIIDKVLSDPNLHRCHQCDSSIRSPADNVPASGELVASPYQHLYPVPFDLRDHVCQLESRRQPGRYRIFSDSTHFQIEVVIGALEERRNNRHEVWFLQLSSQVKLITNKSSVSVDEGQTYLMAPNQEYTERRETDSIGITFTIS